MPSDQGDVQHCPIDYLPESSTCLDCGYSLRDLPERVCPECGRVFNPADPTTYDSPARYEERRNLTARDCGAVAALGLLALALLTCCRCGHMDWLSLIFTTSATAIAWLTTVRPRRNNPAKRAAYFVVAAIASAALLKNLGDILWFGHGALLRWKV